MDESKTTIWKSSTQLILVLFGIVLSITFTYLVFSNNTDKDLINNVFLLFQSCIGLVIGNYFGQKGMFKSPNIVPLKETIKETFTDNSTKVSTTAIANEMTDTESYEEENRIGFK